MNKVVVIGSLNMDLVVRVHKMPELGETVRGSNLSTIPGGKGANQAAAAALLGNQVLMIGRVGKDAFGSALIESLNHAGVNTEYVVRDAASVTGTAMITVDERGNNCIVISPGANGHVAPADLAAVDRLIRSAGLVVLQLEIPLEVVDYAARVARQANVQVVLNAAPAMELPQSLLGLITYLIVNDVEASAMSGVNVCNLTSAEAAARQLLSRGVENVIVTLGENGSLLAAQGVVSHVPAVKVQVVDTTAAGDAFIGGFVTGVTSGLPLLDSVRYGNCAGAIAVTRKGAQTSLPDKDAVDKLYGDVWSSLMAAPGSLSEPLADCPED